MPAQLPQPWEPDISPFVDKLSFGFRVALREAGVGAPIERLVQALGSAGHTVLLSEGIEGFVGGLGHELAIQSPLVWHAPCGWDLADQVKPRLASLVELFAHDLAYVWQSASSTPEEAMAADIAQRVAAAFLDWFGRPAGPARARYSSRLDRVILGEATRQRMASALAVTLHRGARRHLELRLLLSDAGDALQIAVLDCRRRESAERASQAEVDVAMESAMVAAASAAQQAGFEHIAWSWLIRSAYPPAALASTDDLQAVARHAAVALSG